MNAIDPIIANQALKLALEWGEHFHKPIQPRLAVLQPALTPAELDAFNALAVEARDAGISIVTQKAEKHGLRSPKIAAEFPPKMLGRYPWVDADNLNSIATQGMYYAWHDGAPE